MVRYSGELVSGALGAVDTCVSGNRAGFNNELGVVVAAMKQVNLSMTSKLPFA
jgi:hypothetical protein